MFFKKSCLASSMIFIFIYIFKCLVHERFNTIYKRIIGFRAKGI